MSAAALTMDWRRANAEWTRLALIALRLRLRRHAAWLGLASNSRPQIDWLLATADEGSARTPENAEELALQAELQQRELSMPGGRPPALHRLAEIAGLSAFERDLLLLAAAPSLDGAFALAYAELHGDARRDYATLHLGISVLAHDLTQRLFAADSLMCSRPLRSLRLIDVDEHEPEPVLRKRLGIDERISDYLRGVNHVDARVAAMISPVANLPATESAIAAGEEAAALIAAAEGEWTTTNLVGPPGCVREAVRQACHVHGLRPNLLDVYRFAASPPSERATLISLFGREALLAGLAFAVDASGVERGTAAALVVDDLIATLSATLFVMTSEPWPGVQRPAVVRAPRPSRVEQQRLWRVALEAHAHSVNGELAGITQQFDFGPEVIADVVACTARRETPITGRTLWSACREQSGATLGDLARRIQPCYDWDDIIVSDEVRTQLKELASQVQQRGRVYESWGFGAQLGRGRGITALFAGASGTGKTMAAEILANHLDLDLYRIDLAGVVSKFIGETEKNLRRVFDVAEQSGAILFFDEADALFGNRTEVRDSHDRYANLEINYLLQRMEDYSGLAVLATNRRAALDAAFLRRLRFVIDFRIPGPDDRRRIWERAFPPQAAVGTLDFSLLSGLDLTGGNIKSIAVNAAFLAASGEAPIDMSHVVRAASREYVKLSKPISAAEFGSYYTAVRR